MLEEAINILLAVKHSARILLLVLKHYFEGVSKIFFAVTELYNREKNHRQNTTSLKLVKMFEKQRWTIKLQQEIKKDILSTSVKK